jgi:integrase
MTLTEYCAPIRDMPVNQIATKDVLAVLTPLWTKTPETASRLRCRIEAVLNRARVLGHIDEDRANPARWKGHLDHLLPNPLKTGKPRGHFAAMPYADVPAFTATLGVAVNGRGARALMFLILTAGRSEEVRGAVWDEVDLDAAVWTVPAERMKGGRLHRVPLSEPARYLGTFHRGVKHRNKNNKPKQRPKFDKAMDAIATIVARGERPTRDKLISEFGISDHPAQLAMMAYEAGEMARATVSEEALAKAIEVGDPQVAEAIDWLQKGAPCAILLQAPHGKPRPVFNDWETK